MILLRNRLTDCGILAGLYILAPMVYVGAHQLVNLIPITLVPGHSPSWFNEVVVHDIFPLVLAGLILGTAFGSLSFSGLGFGAVILVLLIVYRFDPYICVQCLEGKPNTSLTARLLHGSWDWAVLCFSALCVFGSMVFFRIKQRWLRRYTVQSATKWMIDSRMYLCLCLIAFSLVARESIAFYDNPRAVPTFESIGLYWQPKMLDTAPECTVEYRKGWTGLWQQAYPLWFDTRNRQYRGSIVGLEPGTLYTIRLTLTSLDESTVLRVRTWPQRVPIGKTYYLPAGEYNHPLGLWRRGRAGGYALITTRPGETATINLQNNPEYEYGIQIGASHIILRDIVIKEAKQDGIRMNVVHDIRIESCDISGWGRQGTPRSPHKGFAWEQDSGIRSKAPKGARFVIQGNRIHHPRHGANTWFQEHDPGKKNFHPGGARAISWGNNQGNHVIRYNEIYSDTARSFNDGIGGWHNNSEQGFPGPDSDVYGNYVDHCMDDALEIEGGGCNVRVWGNYIDNALAGIATAACIIGPVYVYRNVLARSRWVPYPDGDTDAPAGAGTDRERVNRGCFAKTVGRKSGGAGRQYWFHNTMLQPSPPKGNSLTLGAENGIMSVGHTGMYQELISHNNIWHVSHPIQNKFSNRASIWDGTESTLNRFDYDLYNGTLIELSKDAQANGIRGIPIYAPGHGPAAGPAGKYQLAVSSPGYDAGKRLLNFNDGYHGAAPDMGAHENGTRPMQFGIDAYQNKVKNNGKKH